MTLSYKRDNNRLNNNGFEICINEFNHALNGFLNCTTENSSYANKARAEATEKHILSIIRTVMEDDDLIQNWFHPNYPLIIQDLKSINQKRRDLGLGTSEEINYQINFLQKLYENRQRAEANQSRFDAFQHRRANRSGLETTVRTTEGVLAFGTATSYMLTVYGLLKSGMGKVLSNSDWVGSGLKMVRDWAPMGIGLHVATNIATNVVNDINRGSRPSGRSHRD